MGCEGARALKITPEGGGQERHRKKPACLLTPPSRPPPLRFGGHALDLAPRSEAKHCMRVILFVVRPGGYSNNSFVRRRKARILHNNRVVTCSGLARATRGGHPLAAISPSRRPPADIRAPRAPGVPYQAPPRRAMPIRADRVAPQTKSVTVTRRLTLPKRRLNYTD